MGLSVGVVGISLGIVVGGSVHTSLLSGDSGHPFVFGAAEQ